MSNQKKVKDGWKLLYECNLFTNGHGSMKNDKKLQVKFKWSAEKWTLWKRSVKLITKTFKNVRKKIKMDVLLFTCKKNCMCTLNWADIRGINWNRAYMNRFIPIKLKNSHNISQSHLNK